MAKNLYCVVGESGSGKDTIVNYMCNRYGYTKVISNTTRPIRTNDENDKLNHIFSNVEQYQKDKENNEVVAEGGKVTTTAPAVEGYEFDDWYVEYGGATKTQVDNSDFYIIDIKGLKHLQDTYRDKMIFTIYVETNEATRKLRMEERGNSEEKIEERIKNDKEAFADVDYQHWDCIIRNSRHSDLSVIAMKLNDVIKSFESKEE